MEDYNKNLILKHQKNLVSSLGMKFDEQLNKYLFVHKKKVMETLQFRGRCRNDDYAEYRSKVEPFLFLFI